MDIIEKVVSGVIFLAILLLGPSYIYSGYSLYRKYDQPNAFRNKYFQKLSDNARRKSGIGYIWTGIAMTGSTILLFPLSYILGPQVTIYLTFVWCSAPAFIFVSLVVASFTD